MAVTTFTEEFSSPVQADRLFKALILDADNLLPKLIPDVIKGVELVEGNGGPGSIKKMTIAEGSTTQHLKHRIDAVDKEKLTYSYTLIEGEELGDKVESISYEIKFEATAEGGTKVKNVSNYHLKGSVEIKEEDISVARQKGLAIFKVVESYLVAKPEAYA